jgi:hypothetical protein
MGGKSGGTQVVYPETKAAPTAAQSAEDLARALPIQYEAALKYQPQFDALDYASFAKYAPEYTKVYDEINKRLYPETYGLQEQLAKQASEGMSGQVPDWMQQQYRDQMNAQLGTNVNAPIGADYMSRGLLDQAQQYRQYYQNLGLSVAGRQPLTTASYQPGSYNVANQFAGNYNTMIGGYGAYSAAARPLTVQQGTPNWIPGLQAAGSVLQGIGSMGRGAAAAGCWVAAACFGGWHAPKTIYARFYINNHAPKLLKSLYIRFGKRISKNKLLVKILKPLFERIALMGKKKLYGELNETI